MIYREKCKRLFVTICTTLTVPTLVVNDLFLVKPMASFTGYLTYLKFSLGTAKGGIDERTAIINKTPFTYEPMTREREAYTSDRISEKFDSVGATEDYILSWGPAANGKVEAFVNNAWTEVSDALLVKDAAGKVIGVAKTAFADGTKLRYVYDNIVIPQAKLPTLVANMEGLTLEAKARRIAVNYSQIAAFQA